MNLCFTCLVYGVVSGKISVVHITLNTLVVGKMIIVEIDYRNVCWLEWIQDKD